MHVHKEMGDGFNTLAISVLLCDEKTALSEGTYYRAFLFQPANALHRHPQRKASASSAHVA